MHLQKSSTSFLAFKEYKLRNFTTPLLIYFSKKRYKIIVDRSVAIKLTSAKYSLYACIIYTCHMYMYIA